MGMASRALSPLLPTSWFRRRPSAPSTDPEEARAYEIEKRQWIDEQKRLIAEAMRRSGGPDPRWNENDGGKDERRQVKERRTPVIEELSAFEIKKRRWMAEHQRSIARERQLSRFQAALRDRQVHPLASATETAGDLAKRPCVDDEKSGGDSDPCDRWLAERDEARKRRQSYLTNYCPFQREEESVPEEEEDRKRTEPDDDAEIEPTVPVLPADGPGSVDGEFVMKSAIGNPWGARRHSEEYYARRRQVLQSFKFVIDGSEKAGVSEARRPASACATRRRNVMSVLGFARVPAAAKTCCTADAVDVVDRS